MTMKGFSKGVNNGRGRGEEEERAAVEPRMADVSIKNYHFLSPNSYYCLFFPSVGLQLAQLCRAPLYIALQRMLLWSRVWPDSFSLWGYRH